MEGKIISLLSYDFAFHDSAMSCIVSLREGGQYA
jgi:hypothetical protein